MTYAPRLTRDDGRIDWQHSADAIDRRIRALTPWPGTFTTMADGTVLKIGAAQPDVGMPAAAAPGTLVDNRLSVACGDGTIRLTRLQRPGKGMMEAEAFLRGQPLPAGTHLGTPHD